MTRWVYLIFFSACVAAAQGSVATQCFFYTCDEWYAFSRGMVTGLIALAAHFLDWQKKPKRKRADKGVLLNGLFWSGLVGGMSGGLAPLLISNMSWSLGGFGVWLELIIAAGLGISAGNIATALKAGISLGVRSLIKAAFNLDEKAQKEGGKDD
jgi:hypothetical protein